MNPDTFKMTHRNEYTRIGNKLAKTFAGEAKKLMKKYHLTESQALDVVFKIDAEIRKVVYYGN